MAKPDKDELKFIADRLVERVWQNDEGKRGLATQCASVALAGIQDYTAARYMETADKFEGRDMVQRWLNRHALLEEARASVALDKGDGETQSLDEGGAYTRKASEFMTGITAADEDMLDGLPDKSPKLEEIARRRLAKAQEDAHPDGWRDDL